MGFFHEIITLAYFVFLRGRLSVLSVIMGFFRTFGFPSILVGFSIDQKESTLQCSTVLVASRRPNIGNEHNSSTFFIEFDRHALQGQPSQNVELVYVKYVFPKMDSM